MSSMKKKILKTCISLALVFSILFSTLGNYLEVILAAEEFYATGVVSVSSLNLRDKPDNYSGSKVIVSMPNGTVINIKDQKQEGVKTWYYGSAVVNGVTYEGWCFGPYMTVTLNAAEATFAQKMIDLGFPESYIPYLYGVHLNHPNWVFEPVLTNLDWNYVIEQESVHRRNLVAMSSNDSRKSTSSAAYNYYTNQWHPEDTGLWVDAHPNYIRYCMDPRNFINTTNIFMFESASFSSSHTVEDIMTMLAGTWMASENIEAFELTSGKDGYITGVGASLGQVSYAQAIFDICKYFNLNPYHITSRLRQEQGVNKGSMMSGTYPGFEGYYNAFNFGASGNSDEEVRKNGLGFAKARGWDTPYKAIFGGASRLTDSYISRGQDTLYFQKFHVIDTSGNTGLFWHQYMQNIDAPYSEAKTLLRGYADLSQMFVFRIPVYLNMPQERCTFTDKGNPNNYLSSLSVKDIKLSPNFDGGVTTYSAVVQSSVTKAEVTATAVYEKAEITGTGTYDLVEGDNQIVVTCKAQNGEQRPYVINIRRQTVEESQAPVYSSDKYVLDPRISGIEPGTSVEEFLATFSLTNCTAQILKADGTVNEGKIGTGNRLLIKNGDIEVANHELIIYGDVNGDGSINILDLVAVDAHITKVSLLEGIYLDAANADKQNEGINIIDLVKIDQHITKVSTISQK